MGHDWRSLVDEAVGQPTITAAFGLVVTRLGFRPAPDELRLLARECFETEYLEAWTGNKRSADSERRAMLGMWLMAASMDCYGTGGAP